MDDDGYCLVRPVLAARPAQDACKPLQRRCYRVQQIISRLIRNFL